MLLASFTTRLLVRALVATMLAATAAAVPAVGSASPSPVAPSETSIRVAGIDRSAASSSPSLPRGFSRAGSRLAALTGKQDAEPFRLVGVTWSGSRDDVAVFVRTRTADRWSSWTELEVDSDHAADPSTDEGRRQRGGTEPLLVDPSDGVQVRVDDLPGGSTGAPADTTVSLVDPGRSDADAQAGASRAGSASGAATTPDVLTRAQWGADESIRRGNPSYGDVKAGFVHHTVNSNTYRPEETAGMIRAIYAYHVKSRGWDDIGYNFIVDRFGRVWEGRHGGIDKPVIGAHTAGYNSQSFAMSALGSYEATSVPAAVERAYARVYAWKLGLHHVDPSGFSWLRNNGKTLVTRSISGHRDAGSTACPGERLYARLPAIRKASRDRQGAMFFNPKMSKKVVPYGELGPDLNARARGRIAYRLEVHHPCGGMVRYRRGFASDTAPIASGWSGRLANGKWAPPGYYTITLTATDRSGASADVPMWTSERLWIRSTPSSPPSFCQQGK